MDLERPPGIAVAIHAFGDPFFLASDGTSDPLRCHVRAPGLMNVQAIPLVARGRLLSDMVAIIGSLDFVMGEVDR